MGRPDWPAAIVCDRRGLAARLMTVLANEIAARGATPFLHVSESNRRAIDLYARLGFIERVRLPLWKMQRSG
ncbi:MAG TPA: GNAT family N-acetyltransferase [Steroidobacteraceae bacterium]|nr:GNAT family N-acetyltransferase [Steroidobacteraceae bacterium]HQX47025.1 GNAT family N-acetyltransferase [Steroidobacteraceae bacterium]HQX80045.1 GNAT family N-acetyltransferase [Steroidobacteraceae bacterium]